MISTRLLHVAPTGLRRGRRFAIVKQSIDVFELRALSNAMLIVCEGRSSLADVGARWLPGCGAGWGAWSQSKIAPPGG